MYSKRFCVLATAAVGLVSTFAPFALGKGNLSVTLADGVLQIVGDKEANEIIIWEHDDLILVGGCDREYNFQYLPWFPSWLNDCPSGGPTTVNGGEPLFFQASEVSEIIVIAGGGRDWLFIAGALGGDLSVDCGAGDDWTRFCNPGCAIAGNLYFNSGNGHDEIQMEKLCVSGAAHFTTGNGRDRIHFMGFNDFVGDVTINMGGHEDHIHAFGESNTVYGNLSVQMGQGDDFVEGWRWAHDPTGPQLNVAGDAYFAGDQGFDTLRDPSSLIVSGTLDIVGFEAE